MLSTYIQQKIMSNQFYYIPDSQCLYQCHSEPDTFPTDHENGISIYHPRTLCTSYRCVSDANKIDIVDFRMDRLLDPMKIHRAILSVSSTHIEHRTFISLPLRKSQLNGAPTFFGWFRVNVFYVCSCRILQNGWNHYLLSNWIIIGHLLMHNNAFKAIGDSLSLSFFDWYIILLHWIDELAVVGGVNQIHKLCAANSFGWFNFDCSSIKPSNSMPKVITMGYMVYRFTHNHCNSFNALYIEINE